MPADPEAEEVAITIVAGIFRARTGREADLAAVLSRYVVLTRSVTGCRNVDLAAEASGSGSFLVVEKWADSQAQRAHLDSEHMVTMARSATDLLAAPPELALYASISAHDLD
ncbi:MAG TPA: antibiotic biosynthesis monooxygenase [Acidimicrobiia bacterium]|nr:antibiotic biosynthesis monooxygenase [Acidimicrobiia bacterium]